MHEGGGKWVGSNKVVELKNNNNNKVAKIMEWKQKWRYTCSVANAIYLR